MKIEQLINNITLDTKKTKKVLDFLKLYNVESYIYPNVFVNKCKISLKESYDIMSILRTNGYVKPVFALYCFKCQKFVTGPYDNLNEIPEDIECDFCDETVDIVNNIVTYYEVIKQLGESNV
jgi:hypothetical protein